LLFLVCVEAKSEVKFTRKINSLDTKLIPKAGSQRFNLSGSAQEHNVRQSRLQVVPPLFPERIPLRCIDEFAIGIEQKGIPLRTANGKGFSPQGKTMDNQTTHDGTYKHRGQRNKGSHQFISDLFPIVLLEN
jgi:hypothetical protein